jgi:hypothetical protein
MKSLNEFIKETKKTQRTINMKVYVVIQRANGSKQINVLKTFKDKKLAMAYMKEQNELLAKNGYSAVYYVEVYESQFQK